MEIRKACPDDIPEIIKLAKSLYSNIPWVDEEPFYRWQFFENINPSVLFVAAEHGRISGMFGIQKREISTGAFGGQVSWINIAQDRRGKGLFEALGSAALSCFPELDFLFIFSNEAGRKPCETKLGLRFPEKIKNMVLTGLPGQPGTEPAGCEKITPDTRFPARRMFENGISFERRAEFRTWRFASSPVYDYFKMELETGEFSVFKIYRNPSSGETCGDIVDLECRLSDRLATTRLLLSTCAVLKKNGTQAASIWAVPGTDYFTLLAGMGFRESDYESNFGIKALNSGCDFLYDLSRWTFFQSDATNF